MRIIGQRIGTTSVGLALMLGVAGCQGPVPMPPEKAGESVADVLLPGGIPVGRTDETARQLPGGEDGAYALFKRLTVGASVVTPANFPGEVRRRADGMKVSFLPATPETLPAVLVQVQAPGKGVAIRRLEFPPGWKKDGGGPM